jgi:hypothetical protein
MGFKAGLLWIAFVTTLIAAFSAICSSSICFCAFPLRWLAMRWEKERGSTTNYTTLIYGISKKEK